MKTLRMWILVADCVWIVVAGACMEGVEPAWYGYSIARPYWTPSFTVVVIGTVAFWVLLNLTKRVDGFAGGWKTSTVFCQLLAGILLCVPFLLAIRAFQANGYTRPSFSLYIAALFLGFVSIRLLIRGAIAVLAKAGALRRVAIVGSGPLAEEIAGKIAAHPELLRKVSGFLCPAGHEWDHSDSGANALEVSAHTLQVLEILQARGVHELIVLISDLSAEAQKLIEKCQSVGIGVSVVPRSYELYVSQAKLDEIGGVPLLSLRKTKTRCSSLVFKRVMDVTIGGALLVMSAPFLILVCGVMRAHGRRALKKVLRCGKGGRQFQMFRLDIDREEPAVGGLERFLVRTSLTEMPQLLNVLRGDMSLVGPRPEPPERVRLYSDWQKRRLTIPPGLTGLAQVNGLREQHSSEAKSKFDMQYILEWSQLGDLSLLLQTAWTVATRFTLPDGPSLAATAQVHRQRPMTIQEGRDAGCA